MPTIDRDNETKKQVDLAFSLLYGLAAIGLTAGLVAGGASLLLKEMERKDVPCKREYSSSPPVGKSIVTTKLILG